MKKNTMAAILMCGCAMSAWAGIPGHHHSNSAQDNEKRMESAREKKLANAAAISYFTIQQFEQDFPDAENAVFTKGNVFDEVNFTLDEIPYTAFYDAESTLVGTTVEKKFSNLPRRAQQEINKKFPDYYVEKVILFDDNEVNATDMYLYDQRFADEDNYFVELRRGKEAKIIQVSMSGYCYAFKTYYSY